MNPYQKGTKMPELEKTGMVPARDIMADDWFYLADNLYRVVSARTRFIDDVTIVAVAWNDRHSYELKLDLKAYMPFVIYNQK